MSDHSFADTDFRKSDRSGDIGCVEVAITAHCPETVGLRDSVHPRSAVLAFRREEWVAFTAELHGSQSAPDAHRP